MLIIFGIGLGYLLRQLIARKQATSAESKVSKMYEDAKRDTEAMLAEAKNKAEKIVEEEKKTHWLGGSF